MPRRLLVTGGAGFIGANFVHHWKSTRPADRLVVLDALTYSGNLASLDPHLGRGEITFVRGDIADRPLVARLLREHGIDTIVHFAAETHVDRSILEPEPFVRTNVQGTLELLEAARATWGGSRGFDSNAAARYRFHHISTDEVYGELGPSDPPATEGSRYAPSSPYAASKAGADHLVRAYHRTYALPITITNSTNNYGPFQFPEKLLPLMLIHGLAGQPLPIYGDGRNVRDWLHVDDHCRGIAAVLASGRVGETYNIGAGQAKTNLEVVGSLCRALDREFAADPSLAVRFPHTPAARGERTEDLITFVPDRPGHDLRYALDAEKIRRELGFAPSELLETGLVRTIRWYLANEPWWARRTSDEVRSPSAGPGPAESLVS